MRRSFRAGALLAGACVAGSAAAAITYWEGRARNLHGLPAHVARVRDRHLPNIPLVTQDGRTVRFYDDLVRGRVVAINFMYTGCTQTCPLSTSNLVEVQSMLRAGARHDVTFLSISINPDFDAPEALRAYARASGAPPGWMFLTGKFEDIEDLRRRLGAYELDEELDRDRTQHTGIVILGNEPRGRWKAIPALAHPVRIRQAIERLILPVTEWQTGDKAINEVPAVVSSDGGLIAR